MEIITKREVIELDLINKYILFFNDVDDNTILPSPQKINVDDEIIDKFLASAGSFWHTDKDKLEVFIYFNTGEYLCQRNKFKYNFETKANYWETYNFKGASKEQCDHLVNAIVALRIIIREIKSLEIIQKVEKIEEQNLFFRKRYMKKKNERNLMLASSDWRVLPDVEESFEGEKDMWIKWRKNLRENTVKSPDEFSSNLEFATYIYNVKFPIDPIIYKRNYPNNEVGYLETEDQWVKYDAEASVDFINNRLVNFINYNKDYVNQYQEVKQEIYDIIKAMEVHENNPDFNITKFIIKEE
jgi:hypothetical protein